MDQHQLDYYGLPPLIGSRLALIPPRLDLTSPFDLCLQDHNADAPVSTIASLTIASANADHWRIKTTTPRLPNIQISKVVCNTLPTNSRRRGFTLSCCRRQSHVKLDPFPAGRTPDLCRTSSRQSLAMSRYSSLPPCPLRSSTESLGSFNKSISTSPTRRSASLPCQYVLKLYHSMSFAFMGMSFLATKGQPQSAPLH